MIATDLIPSVLATQDRWIVFARTTAGRKQPYSARTLKAIGWDQHPADLGTAVKALGKRFTDVDGQPRRPEGVGLLMGDGVCGIDLDSAIYLDETGRRRLRAWAKPIVAAAKAAGCWIERSISETGLHIVGTADEPPAFDTKKVEVPADPGEPPPGEGAHSQQVDLFTSGYFTVSGHPIQGGLPERDAPMGRISLGPIAGPWRAAVDLIASVRGERSPRVGGTTDPKPAGTDDEPALPTKRPKARDGRRSGGVRLSSPMDLINDWAVAHLDEWFPAAFPVAQRSANGAWKIEAADLGRDGSDRLSAQAGVGINDHWAKRDPDEARDGRRTPVDLLIGEAYEAARAEEWSCVSPRDAAIKLAIHLDVPDWIVGAFKRSGEAVAAGEATNVFRERPQPLKSPPWPADVLPPGLAGLADAHAARLRAPSHLLRFTMLMGAVMSIPGGVGIDIFGDGGYVPGAAFYATIFGGSGSAKSPAWKAGLAPLVAIEGEWAADYARRKATFDKRERRAAKRRQRGEEAADPGGEPSAGSLDAVRPNDDEDASPHTDDRPAPMTLDTAPKRRRRTAHDATSEALVALMQEHDSGLVLVVDEMSGFLGSLDKYGGGSRGGSADSATYLSMYDGSPVGRDRVKSASTYAARSHLSIATGVQPAVLAPLLENLATDGLLQRFVWVIAPGLLAVDRDLSPIDERATELHRTAVRLLLDLRTDGEPAVVLTASPGALAAWSAFDHWCSDEGPAAARSETERNVIAKAPNTALRLALGLRLLWWSWGAADLIVDGLADEADPPALVIEEVDMRRAVVLVRDFLLPSARVAFEASVADVLLDDMRAVARAIREKTTRGRNRAITPREIGQWVRRLRGRRNDERLHDAMTGLVERGLIVREDDGFRATPTLFDIDDPGAS